MNFGQPWVNARCPSTGRILLGGLGALGVGEMWFDELPRHANYPGYAEAKIFEAEEDWLAVVRRSYEAEYRVIEEGLDGF